MPSSPPSCARAFSLAELLIAMGILGLGMAMAGALFPTAMKLNEFSNNDTLGSMICRNALVAAQSALVQGMADATLPPEWRIPTGDPENPANSEDFRNCTGLLPPGAREYPRDPADPTSPVRGALLLARRVAANETRFDLILVSYALSNPSNHPAWYWPTVSTTVPAGKAEVSLAEWSDMTSASDRAKLVGSPVIATNGRFAMITAIDGDRNMALLDRAVHSTDATVLCLLVERNSSDNLDGPRSPVLMVLSTRVGLRK